MAKRQTSNCSEGCEELAYMLLEETRLRCWRLLGDEGDSSPDPDRLSLNGIYGDLGTAGYYAGAHLRPARRKQLLAQAHRRAARLKDGLGAVRALAQVMAEATRAVERTQRIKARLDQMHLAHIYIMSACEALDATLAPALERTLT